MSRYATNKVLWEVAGDGDLARTLTTSSGDALAGRDLTEEEHTALAAQDIRGLFLLGVHPFLLYNFALRLEGGFSMAFMKSYLDKLEGLTMGDVET